jgi:cytochrome c peroxidase
MSKLSLLLAALGMGLVVASGVCASASPDPASESALPTADGAVTRAGTSGESGDVHGTASRWNVRQLATLRSLSLTALAALPADPSNAVADDPRAARFGEALFFDPRLSANGQVSCASCHKPQHAFADTTTVSTGIGTTRRNAPGLRGAAWQQWFYWDGRRDSQWAQALAPLEHADEHGLSRVEVVQVIARDEGYRRAYGQLFAEPLPPLEDEVRFARHASPLGGEGARAAWAAMDADDREWINRAFAGAGKVLAAFQRTLRPWPSRFDAYVAALDAGDMSGGGHLNAQEQRGLALFIGERAQCTRCHNGPRLSNGEFKNIGLVRREDPVPDAGRLAAVREVRGDPFNCLGSYSDADPEACAELTFMKTAGSDLLAAFRVPSLRDVGRTAPYMHDGRFPTLEAVIGHYVAAPQQVFGHQELEPLRLNADEIRELLAFLRALDGIEPRGHADAGYAPWRSGHD